MVVPDHMSSEQAAQDYLRLCQPHIAVQEGNSVLVHLSAKDYILRVNQDNEPTLEKFRIRPADFHLDLAEACTEHLAGDLALTKYALLHWAEHARQCAGYMNLLVARNKHFFCRRTTLRKTPTTGHVHIMYHEFT